MGIVCSFIAALAIPWLAGMNGQPGQEFDLGLVGPEPTTFTVAITQTGYHPATLTVRHGDVVRFVQVDGERVHNVEFFAVPEGTRMVPEYLPPVGGPETGAAVLRVGPDLLGPGQAYEVVIGEDLPEGAYSFGCSRHEKMRGLLVVWNFEELP